MKTWDQVPSFMLEIAKFNGAKPLPKKLYQVTPASWATQVYCPLYVLAITWHCVVHCIAGSYLNYSLKAETAL